MPAGNTLRLIDPEPFRVVWTADGWATKGEMEAVQVGSMGSFADLPTAVGQVGSLKFTLFFPERNQWLGQDYTVAITQPKDEAGAGPTPPVAVKPSN